MRGAGMIPSMRPRESEVNGPFFQQRSFVPPPQRFVRDVAGSARNVVDLNWSMKNGIRSSTSGKPARPRDLPARIGRRNVQPPQVHGPQRNPCGPSKSTSVRARQLRLQYLSRLLVQVLPCFIRNRRQLTSQNIHRSTFLPELAQPQTNRPPARLVGPRRPVTLAGRRKLGHRLRFEHEFS